VIDLQRPTLTLIHEDVTVRSSRSGERQNRVPQPVVELGAVHLVPQAVPDAIDRQQRVRDAGGSDRGEQGAQAACLDLLERNEGGAS
jgi:hypothetical protein